MREDHFAPHRCGTISVPGAISPDAHCEGMVELLPSHTRLLRVETSQVGNGLKLFKPHVHSK
jgi:hypothetical protein